MDSVYETRGITLEDGIEHGLLQTDKGLVFGKSSVSEQSALGISAIWCGLKVISEAVGSLPIILKNKDGSVAENHPLQLLFDEPNPEQTRPVFYETVQAHALLWGNAYAEIERDEAGRPVALWPIHPRNMKVTRNEGGLLYSVNVEGLKRDFRQPDIIHVPGLSPDGSVGYRLLTIARDTISFALSAQRYGNALFRNMVRPGGALEYPGVLSDTARENLRRSWQQLHSGDNTGSMAILEEGMQFRPFTMTTNEQTQYRELLQWFVYEAARLFNCPPSKIHSLEKASWGNLETLNQDFLTTTLRPWLEKWEAEQSKKLIMPSEKGRYYVEFVTDSLLRTDKPARYTAYSVALNNGFLSVNEVRAQEGLPPVKGGDVYRTPLNMAPASPKQDQPKPQDKPNE